MVRTALDALVADAPRWLAILGPRRVGKTSLLLEAARRAPASVRVAVLDVMERAPLDLELFRAIAILATDALLSESAGGSLEQQAHHPDAFRALLHESPLAARLSPAVRVRLDRLPDERATADTVRQWLDLPEVLARALDRRLVIAIDEVQEVAALAGRGLEPFSVMRAVWQKHTRVAYVVSGSAPSVLRELVSAKHSPFFQHFQLLELGPFAKSDAISLLVESAPPDRPIPERVAARLVEVLGGHPFYLQLAGEALVDSEPPYDESSLKAIVQSLVFSRTGRLALFFENEHGRLVGRAVTQAATLQAIAEHGPARLGEIARAIGASPASTARYVERLGDTVVRDENSHYALADPLFASWVRWRSPGGTVVPMRIIGDEAEIAVATHLAALGFDLVYQSRGSRGAFDLLALRGPVQLGLQVKRSELPVRLPKREWSRMEADATRWGWRWAVAAVGKDGVVHVLDPAKKDAGRQTGLGPRAIIDNLLTWVDRRVPEPKRRRSQ